VIWDYQGLKASLAQDYQARKANKVAEECQACKAIRVPWESKDGLVLKDQKVRLDHRVHKEKLDHKEIMDQRDHLERVVQRDHQAWMAQWDPPEIKELLDQREIKDQLDLLDQLDHKAIKE